MNQSRQTSLDGIPQSVEFQLLRLILGATMSTPSGGREKDYADNMSSMECDVAATLLEQDAKRMLSLAFYLRHRGYLKAGHDEAANYRDFAMEGVENLLEVL